MTIFNAGDRVRYTAARWKAEGADGLYYDGSIGFTGTVTSGNTNDRDSVRVQWDDPRNLYTPSNSVYAGNVEPLEHEGSKPEDPRTPETVYADSVDELLSTYAKRLHDSADTMVYPYSHLGVLAEFLHAYRAIEKPASLGD